MSSNTSDSFVTSTIKKPSLKSEVSSMDFVDQIEIFFDLIGVKISYRRIKRILGYMASNIITIE